MTKTHVPPSQQSAQGPVAKPGEPLVFTKGLMAPPKALEKPPVVQPPLRSVKKDD